MTDRIDPKPETVASIAHHPFPPTNGELWGYVEDVIGITRRHTEHRRAGTPGDAETRAYLLERLEQFGLHNVKEDTQVFPRREYQSWQLDVAGTTVPSFFLRSSAFTPVDGIEAELLFVEGALRSDVDVAGKIVVMSIDIEQVPVRTLADALADYSFDPKGTLFDGPDVWLISTAKNYPGSYYMAAKMGAAGFVGILPFETGTAQFYPDSSMIVRPEIPALYVGKYDGEDLLAQNEGASAPLVANLTLHGTVDEFATTANVMGILPGNTDEAILVTTHHDSAWEGGVQDASGISVVLGAARYFADQPGDIYRQKTLVFNIGANHFGWDYPASNMIFKDNNPVLFDNLKAVIGLEHIAKRVRVEDRRYVPTGQVDPHFVWAPQHPPMRQVMRDAIEANGLTDSLMIKPGAMALIGEAKRYYFQGIPAYQIISAPPYLYDPVDTIDMVAKDSLAPVARTAIDVVEKLGNVFPGAWIKP